MLAAEAAILLHLEPVGAVLFVLLGVVVALFALRAGERDLHSHYFGTSINSLPLLPAALCGTAPGGA